MAKLKISSLSCLQLSVEGHVGFFTQRKQGLGVAGKYCTTHGLFFQLFPLHIIVALKVPACWNGSDMTVMARSILKNTMLVGDVPQAICENLKNKKNGRGEAIIILYYLNY